MMTDNTAPASATFTIPAEHAALPGHFPGNPIVPGVVILEHVLGVVGSMRACNTGSLRILTAKFLVPLLPDECARIVVQEDGNRYRFAVYRDDLAIATGLIDVPHINTT